MIELAIWVVGIGSLVAVVCGTFVWVTTKDD